jgi:glutathione S-transferase
MTTAAATAPAAEAKSGAPTLHYFPINGRGDFVKILFEDAASPYNFTSHGLGAHKALTFVPFGQLPVLQEASGRVTAQTGTIVRDVAKRLNQYPSNIRDAALAESVADQAYDIIGKYFSNLFGGTTTDDLKTYLTTNYAFLESALAKSESKGEYFTKNFSFADLQVWQLIAVTSTVQAPASGSLLAAHFARISARPNVAAYLASSRWIKPGLPARPGA